MRYIADEDIDFVQKEREKIVAILDGIENKVARKADKTIASLFKQLKTEVVGCVGFDGESLQILVHEQGNGISETSFSDAIEVLLEDDKHCSATDAQRIAVILRDYADRFDAKATIRDAQ